VFRRRRRGTEPEPAPADAAATTEAAAPDRPAADGETVDEAAGKQAKTPRPHGPLDVSEVDPQEPGPPRVDLGGMRVRIGPRMQLQVQVDERSGTGTGLTVVHEGAAVQMIAVAAPRSSGLWEQTRLQVAAEARRRGGTVTEAAGPFGTEVRIVVPVKTAEGKSGLQPSRVVGIDGPRWMLRATFVGKAISDPQAFARLVHVIALTAAARPDSGTEEPSGG
jgi:hypothetical protein